MEQREYFSVVYDIERPYNTYYQTLLKKEKEGTITPQEAAELKRRRHQAAAIDRFVENLKKYGWRINWSVFVFPVEQREKVEELVRKFQAKFDQLGIKYDIYTLEYAPSSSGTIELKVRLHMELTAQKVVERIAKSKYKSEKKALYNELKHLVKLAEVFGFGEDMLKFVNDKLWRKGLPKL